MSGCARKHFLRGQRVAGVRQTGDDIFMCKAWIVLQDVRLAPSVGHQPDYELDRKACASDDGLAHENVGGEGDSGMLGHDPSDNRFLAQLARGYCTRPIGFCYAAAEKDSVRFKATRL